MNKNAGNTFVELLIYIGLLAVFLSVAYELFVQSSIMRFTQGQQNKIAASGQEIVFDLEKTIKNAQGIDSPVFHTQGNTLSLNSQTTRYYLNSNKQFIKNESGEENVLTEKGIRVENLNFINAGPSTIQPSIIVSFILQGQGFGTGVISKHYQASVTLRK